MKRTSFSVATEIPRDDEREKASTPPTVFQAHNRFGGVRLDDPRGTGAEPATLVATVARSPHV